MKCRKYPQIKRFFPTFLIDSKIASWFKAISHNSVGCRYNWINWFILNLNVACIDDNHIYSIAVLLVLIGYESRLSQKMLIYAPIVFCLQFTVTLSICKDDFFKFLLNPTFCHLELCPFHGLPGMPSMKALNVGERRYSIEICSMLKWLYSFKFWLITMLPSLIIAISYLPNDINFDAPVTEPEADIVFSLSIGSFGE